MKHVNAITKSTANGWPVRANTGKALSEAVAKAGAGYYRHNRKSK